MAIVRQVNLLELGFPHLTASPIAMVEKATLERVDMKRCRSAPGAVDT